VHAALLCIVPDGTAPADGTLARVALPSPIEWPIGDSGTIGLSFQGEDGTPYDLTGGVVTLSCREHIADAYPLFTVSAAIAPTPSGGTPPGTALASVLAAHTALMSPGSLCWYDVRLSNGGSTWHVLPASKWIPTGTVVKTGDTGT
jgi:hypothetical protein